MTKPTRKSRPKPPTRRRPPAQRGSGNPSADEATSPEQQAAPSPALAAPALAVKPNPRIELSIVYEDAWLIVVDKPSGLVTQPGKAHRRDSLLNALFARHGSLLQNLGEKRDFGLLHRLDRETSGLVIVAKMPRAYDELRKAFETRTIEKHYLAVAEGLPQPREGLIDAPILEVEFSSRSAARGSKAAGPQVRPRDKAGSPTVRSHATFKKAVISRRGQSARTHYRVLSHTQQLSLLHLRLETGKLHQARVHAALINCPILGDHVYGPETGRCPSPGHLMLHAWRLGFHHPCEPARMVRLESPLPEAFRDVLRERGFKTGELN